MTNYVSDRSHDAFESVACTDLRVVHHIFRLITDLRNLVNRVFGAAFAASSLSVTFPAVEDKEVCVIERQEQLNVDIFYVRSGNSSIDLPMKEIAPYMPSRLN